MDRLASGFGALKELLTIIMGVAIGNIVIAATELTLGTKVIPAGKVPFETPSHTGYAALGLSLILIAVRFFHGNVRALDEDHANNSFARTEADLGPENSGENPGESGSQDSSSILRPASKLAMQYREVARGHAVTQALDLVIVMVQGTVFAAFGLLLQRPQMLWVSLFGLFVSDLFLAATFFLATGTMSPHRTRWAMINMLSVMLLAAEYLFFLPFWSTLASVLVLGSALDYITNWSLYFPTTSKMMLAVDVGK
jgi:hypothetical protein